MAFGLLRNIKYEIGIIFVTSHDEYVMKAMHYSAFDFLLKPVVPEELKNALERFRLQKEHFSLMKKVNKLTGYFDKCKLRLNTHDGFVLINVDYFESFNRKAKTVILTNIIEHYELKVSSSGMRALLKL